MQGPVICLKYQVYTFPTTVQIGKSVTAHGCVSITCPKTPPPTSPSHESHCFPQPKAVASWRENPVGTIGLEFELWPYLKPPECLSASVSSSLKRGLQYCQVHRMKCWYRCFLSRLPSVVPRWFPDLEWLDLWAGGHHGVLWWSFCCVNWTALRVPRELVKPCFWVCLWGCFWKRWAFDSGDWVDDPQQCGWASSDPVGAQGEQKREGRRVPSLFRSSAVLLPLELLVLSTLDSLSYAIGFPGPPACRWQTGGLLSLLNPINQFL